MKYRFKGHLRRVSVVVGPEADRVCRENRVVRADPFVAKGGGSKQRSAWIANFLAMIGLARLGKGGPRVAARR